MKRRPQYDRGAGLVEAVAARVRELHEAQTVTERAVDRAREMHGVAYAQLVDAWRVLRNLTDALGDSACLSKPVDLAAAIDAAEQLVGVETPVAERLPL